MVIDILNIEIRSSKSKLLGQFLIVYVPIICKYVHSPKMPGKKKLKHWRLVPL